MHIVTDTHYGPVRPRRLVKPDAKPTPRTSTWKPQPSGLSRDEIRQIVLDTLG